MKKVQEHLTESGMTYGQHLTHSIKQSWRLIVIAIKSLIHGILPWFYASAGPLGVYRIYKEIRQFHHIKRILKSHDNKS
jgi:hypothetical protein